MEYFFNIFTNILLPIFIVILAGAIINTIFKLDINTLSKVQFNLFIPAIIFIKLYESNLEGSVVVSVTLVCLGVIGAMSLISLIIGRLLSFSKSETSAFINSASYYNGGNFSLPLMQLLFDNPLALSIQAIIYFIQTITLFTTGVITASSGKGSIKNAFFYILKMPLIYVMILAFILKGFDIKIYTPIMDSIKIIGNGFSSLAIITLGAQLANINIVSLDYKVVLSTLLRLIMGPVLAFAFVSILKITGITAQVLIIAMSAPTAVNVALTAIELDNEPEMASQSVFLSTLLSSITVTIVIWVVFAIIPA